MFTAEEKIMLRNMKISLHRTPARFKHEPRLEFIATYYDKIGSGETPEAAIRSMLADPGLCYEYF